MILSGWLIAALIFVIFCLAMLVRSMHKELSSARSFYIKEAAEPNAGLWLYRGDKMTVIFDTIKYTETSLYFCEGKEIKAELAQDRIDMQLVHRYIQKVGVPTQMVSF